ncbi:carbonic anhydrase [Candidatus Methylospira mobilis]|uniref:Carbonic anhydrase n=1 Tax=Candidatus Methylospira mobilis TaxID=1808979 RepID=A0A5Q0BJZ0_9GAMM|nr:carbonic anhydrase [Candidatus Methylospira mobilis]QFY44205.1 carbonic anhydrase [Candidatus Methylospira mobilis]WNV06366.1 carbonic anhydrase [Candidatus Methylospira mobilis]
MNTPVKDNTHSGATCADSLAHFQDAMLKFRERYYTEKPETMRRLLDYGQHPKALMIACSDSRVDPALLVDAGPGDLFMVRNVANLVPPYCRDDAQHGVGAAIEYAVRHLKVEHIIIMGHAHCGGIKALLDAVSGAEMESDFIGQWVSIAEEACRLFITPSKGAGETKQISLEQLKDYPYLVERAAIRGSLQNLLTYPWLKQAVEDGKLDLHGWWFDLETGDLWATDPETGDFMPAT